MTAAVGKYAAKKILGKQMNKNKHKEAGGLDDPYFENIVLPNGKKKKVKRQIPDFIPEHDAMILAKAKNRAYHLDWSLFNFFGIRFGWESAIGLIPEIGDVIGLIFAYNVFSTCCKIDGGLPSGKKWRMGFNIALDFVVGLVPILGDLLDGYIKCNTRNVQILEEYLREKYGPADPNKRKSAGLEAFKGEDDAETLAQLRAMGVEEDTESLEGDGKHPNTRDRMGTNTHGQSRWEGQTRGDQQAPRPPPKDQPSEQRGWFGGRSKTKQQDLESGRAGTSSRR